MSKKKQPTERFVLVDKDDEGDDEGGWGTNLVDTTTGKIVGSDGGEPEDQSFVRDWSWVPGALNAVEAERLNAAAYAQLLLQENKRLTELVRRFEENNVTDHEPVRFRGPRGEEQTAGAGMGEVPESVGVSVLRGRQDEVMISLCPLVGPNKDGEEFHRELAMRLNVRQAYNLYLALSEVLVVPWYEDPRGWRAFMLFTLPDQAIRILRGELASRGITLLDTWAGSGSAFADMKKRIEDASFSTVVRLRAIAIAAAGNTGPTDGG